MMLLLFLFLAGCAVKCDESKNFVVQMPVEDTPVTRNEDLKVYWNVPTKQCRSKKIPFDNLNQFGIIQNREDKFQGEEITILYDPGYFPALLRNESSGELKYRNGGVPQEGDLEFHLKSFASDLHSSIPDRNFSGVGIIDFESWRPVFRQNFGEVLPYQSVSCDIERSRHWFWTEKMIREEAKRRFEESARFFMQYTIALAKKMRPLARWGYYGFPYCFNTAPNNMNEDCPSKVICENNQIKWLWMNSSALYPSVYSNQDLTGSQLVKRIRGRIREAARVRRQNATILPYFSFRYRDAGYFSETDLYTAFNTFTASEASGVIIWGSSNDVNTVEKCENLYKYIYNIFGPLVAKYVKSKKSYKPPHQLHDDEKVDEGDNIIKENYTSTTFNELNDIVINVTTIEPIYNSESSTQNASYLDTSTKFYNNNETIENIVTSSPFSTYYTKEAFNINLETTTVKNNKIEITTNRNVDYINIIDGRENSTESPENTTKEEVQEDDNDDREENTIEELDFSSVTAAPDNLTSDTTVNQVTGWAAIFNTIVTIMNGSNEENSTDFESDAEFETLDDFETSTYLETDLLMNNLSDYNFINAKTTESSKTSTLYSTEETDVTNNPGIETTTSDDLFEIFFNLKEITTSTESILESVEPTTEYEAQDIDNESSISGLKSLIADKTTNVNVEDNNTSTTEGIKDLSHNFNLSTKDNMLRHYNNNERENETESITSTTFENLSSNLMINETTSTTGINNDDSTDRIKPKIANIELTTTDALLGNDSNLSTTEDITITSITSEPERFILSIMKTNQNMEHKINNFTTTENTLENVDTTTKDNLDSENHYEEKTEESLSHKHVTSIPESYSAETIKQVTGSAAPSSRLKYIVCVVIYFSVSKCICDYYGQCE